MVNPSTLTQLSEIHLNQLIAQIKELPYFDGIKSVYSQSGVPFTTIPYSRRPTNSHHIRSYREDSAQRVIEEEKSNTWITTKAALIKAFKDHRPYEDIIQHVRDTQYPGSIS